MMVQYLCMDKWNPADIWMTTLDSADILTQTTSIQDLNALILQLYIDKILIGVSLKKTDLNPPVKAFQVGNEDEQKRMEGAIRDDRDHIKDLKKDIEDVSDSLLDEINKIKGKQSNEIEKILGYLSKSEIIHKDDMVKL